MTTTGNTAQQTLSKNFNNNLSIIKMKNYIEVCFFCFCLITVLGCGSGKELLYQNDNQIRTVNRIAVIGFPGQCTLDGKNITFRAIALERFDSLNRFEIVSIESTDKMADELGIPPIYVNDEYSTLDVNSVSDLCYELEADAVVVGFYRIRISDTQPTTYVDEKGKFVTLNSDTYSQNYPTIEACLIAADGSLIFRAVSEGRKSSFWNSFVDSIFKSESEETFYYRLRDAMDGICDMLLGIDRKD
jgi:hypothetical protein